MTNRQMSDAANISVQSGSKTTTTSSRANNDAYTNICPDGHACDNDATCVESLLQENKYVCDCADAYKQTGRVYAGLSCQHVATEYCTISGELSQTSYCVNEGVCSNKVEPTAPHPGCNCPNHYSGAHCQFISGSEPIETSYFFDGTTYASVYRDTEGPGINPAAIVLPILFVTMGALCYFLWRYRGFNLSGIAIGARKDHVVDKTKKADENMLEADGTSMSTSMSQIGSNPKLRRNSTPAFSSTHKAALMDPPDFEDLLEQSDHVAFHMDPTGTATHKMFASDPTLNYVATTSSSGSGSSGNSPTNYTEEYDLSSNQVFEEYDPKDFTTQDFTTTAPTTSTLNAAITAGGGTAQDYITASSNPYQSSSHQDYSSQDYTATSTTTHSVGAFTYGDVHGPGATYGGVTDFGDTKDPSLT